MVTEPSPGFEARTERTEVAPAVTHDEPPPPPDATPTSAVPRSATAAEEASSAASETCASASPSTTVDKLTRTRGGGPVAATGGAIAPVAAHGRCVGATAQSSSARLGR